MDWNIIAKVVALSANRALGLLIAKSKSLGGMPYDIYTKLFDSMIWPVIWSFRMGNTQILVHGCSSYESSKVLFGYRQIYSI